MPELVKTLYFASDPALESLSSDQGDAAARAHGPLFLRRSNSPRPREQVFFAVDRVQSTIAFPG